MRLLVFRQTALCTRRMFPKLEMCSEEELPKRLEALSVDNRGSRLIILLLGDPHLLESG